MRLSLDRFYSIFFISEKGRFTSLEGVRALAIFLVFNVHVLSSFYKQNYFTDSEALQTFFATLAAGHIGVDLFFVLSGFLIIRTISKNSSLLEFMIKRYKRLWPIVFVTSFFLVFNKPAMVIFDNLSLLMLATDKPRNFVNWSLTYEIYFYFFTAIWFFYLQKFSIFKGKGIYIFGVLLIALFNFLANNTSTFFIKEPFRFIGFFWGILLAHIYDSHIFQSKLMIKISQNIWIVPLFTIPALQYVWATPSTGVTTEPISTILFYVIVQSQFFLLLISLLNPNSRASYFFSLKPLRYLGTISYSFYVIHWIWGIKLTNSLLKNLPDTPTKIFYSLLLAFILNIFFASLMFLWLEKPYFKKKKILTV